MSSGVPGRPVEKLALLVGSNPLPNYIAAAMLAPSEVTLIHSPETAKPCRYLAEALQALGMKLSEKCIDDATEAARIRDLCQPLVTDHHLHYSGGTKPMAAHARMLWGNDDGRASYLDERGARLRFDDGFDECIAQHDLGLSLARLVALHGGDPVPQPIVEGAPADQNIELIAQDLLQARSKQDLSRRKEMLLQQGIPTNANKDAWSKCINHGWLEWWVGTKINELVGPQAEAQWGVKVVRGEPKRGEFELDVVLLRGPRLYVVECTTTFTKAKAKEKLFEAAARARHMGGDLARVALVCLVPTLDDRKQPTMDQLRDDIEEVWDSHYRPVAFGFDDVQEWAAPEPNLATLRQWLDT